MAFWSYTASVMVVQSVTDPTESYPLNAHYPEVVTKLAEEMYQWQKAMEEDPLGMLIKQDDRK
jgi:hypothetical protein